MKTSNYRKEYSSLRKSEETLRLKIHKKIITICKKNPNVIVFNTEKYTPKRGSDILQNLPSFLNWMKLEPSLRLLETIEKRLT